MHQRKDKLASINVFCEQNIFVVHIPTHVSHYMSPREERPVCMTNHEQRLREHLFIYVTARVHLLTVFAESGPYVLGGHDVLRFVGIVCLLLKPRVRKITLRLCC